MYFFKIFNLFEGCSSLNYLPNIIKWNIKNVIQINNIFDGCYSLLFLPDMSKLEFNDKCLKDLNSSISSLFSLNGKIKKNEIEEDKFFFEKSKISDISNFSSIKIEKEKTDSLSNFSIENNNLSLNEEFFIGRNQNFNDLNNLNNEQNDYYENFYN